MFEGHDTTTSGMCWTLYCLAQHPEHQQKVREEVDSVLAGRQNLTYDDLKELYTQCCIKEAMRLYEAEEDMEQIQFAQCTLGDHDNNYIILHT